MADTSLSDLGSQPITPEAPCGESARYEPEYESLEAEIAKLGTLTAQGEAGQVDWSRVVNFGAAILREKSKDLLVASYLSRGLFEQQGYAGLETAFTIYRDLIGEHWEALFPAKKRMRGRLAAITWLAESLETAIERQAPTVFDHDAVKHCHELLQEMGELLNEKLDDMDPMEREQLLSPLPARLQRLLRDLEQQAAQPEEPPEETPEAQPQAEPEVVAEAPTEATDTAPEAAAVPPEVTPEASPAPPAPEQPAAPPAVSVSTTVSTAFEKEADAQRALRDCQTILRNVGSFLLSQNLANPLPYRLNRIGTWMMVLQAPPSQDGVTQLTGVQPNVVQGYEEALQGGNHAALINSVESSFPRASFWLDAHHYVVKALEALGPSHAEAAKAIVEELGSFLRRVPGVLDLKFADGMPFASDQARAWIDSSVLGASRRGGAAGRPARVQRPREATVVVAPSGDGEQQTAWTQIAQEAQQLAAEGKVLEGASLFQDGQKRATSQRERFMWRLQQARFCFDMGLLEVAIPQLEFLEEQGERFGLDEWEPLLSLDVVQLLLRCYYTLSQEAEPPPPELGGKTERLHARLCRLDVTAALAIDETV